MVNLLNEEAIRDKLLDYQPLADLVGTRIFPLLRFGDMPSITFQQISQPRQQYGTIEPRYQFSLWCNTYSELKQLETAFIDATEHLTEIDGIVATYIEGNLTNYEEDTKIYSKFIDIFIRYVKTEQFED